MPDQSAWDVTPWQTARNILCVRLDTLGDVLMTTPAFRALKESFPGCRLTLLTSAAGARIAPLIPEIDAVRVYQAPWMKASPSRAAAPGASAPSAAGESADADLAHIAELRQAGYDAAIIFTVFSQNPLPAAWMLYLAEIPLRLAYCRENPYQLLTHWAAEVDTAEHMRHEVLRHLDLVAGIGAVTQDEHLSLRVPEGSWPPVELMLRQMGVDLSRPWLVVHPGASAASRRYAPASYARVAAGLAQRGFQVLFTGSPGERSLVQEIRQMAQQLARKAQPVSAISLAGLLELDQLAALIQQAPLLISNNTGPAHMAAALGTPVVDIYALTNPQHTPWQVPNRVLNHDVPCKYCYKSTCPLEHNDCLRLLAPHEVVQAALDLLRETGRLPDGLTPSVQAPIVPHFSDQAPAAWRE